MTHPPVPETGVPTCYRHPGRETYINCQRCGRPICPDCMRDAAVGFQCPACVAEGARSTRSGRTAYGGLRSGNPALTSMVLAVVNGAVWLLILATGGSRSAWIDRLALLPRGRCTQGAYYYPDVTDAATCHADSVAHTWIPGVADGAPWQLITSMFTHVELTHIGFNMLALWLLGPQLELAIGRARFLALYFGSGLAGSAAVYWLAPQTSSTLGASGAIFGLMAALLIVAIKVRGNVSSIMMWLGLNAVITLIGGSKISWQGHLGGFLGGLAIAALVIYAPRERRALWQWLGTGAVVAVIAIAIVARTVVLAH